MQEALPIEQFSPQAFKAYCEDRLDGSPLSVVDYKFLDQEDNWTNELE